MTEALVVEAISGAFKLCDLKTRTPLGKASGRGLLKRDGNRIWPGDIVEVLPSGDDSLEWRIEAVKPRTSLLERPPIANLNQLNIVCSASVPEIDYYLLDRLLIICATKKIRPVIVVTKLDLPMSDKGMKDISDQYARAGYKIVTTSLSDETVPEAVMPQHEGDVVAFVGQSGVGKSTLVNRIMPEIDQITGELSQREGRGKQTTKHTVLLPFGCGYIADTAGFWNLMLDKTDMVKEDVINGYPELKRLERECRYANCTHNGEVGCAIEHHLDEFSYERLKRYRKLLLEAIKQWQQDKIRAKR